MKTINKQLRVIFLAVMLLTIAASCRRGASTTIVTNSDSLHQKIEYGGRVIFNEAQNDIEKISSGGFLKFERNGERFEAEQGTKGVVYSFNGDSKVNTLSDAQKSFVAQAVREIIKERSKRKAGN
jgi:hypothetical protein